MPFTAADSAKIDLDITEWGNQMKASKIASVVAITLASTLVLSQSSIAAPVVHAKAYKNCTDLRKSYPGGVAKSKSSTNKGGKIKKTPTVNAKVYASNKQMDRDGDGIACEN
jgi:hypothetical protein